MELFFHGANCVSLISKSAKLVIDPTIPGQNFKTDKYDIIANTGINGTVVTKEEQLVLNTPGEYEAKGITVQGISARAHMDEELKSSAIIYRVLAGGVRIGFTGHIYPELSDEQLEAIGSLDILVIPVGGNGYTLDAEGASRVVRAIEPKIVIPTHYADPALKFEVPQSDLKLFLDEIGSPTIEESSLKIKSVDFPEQLTVVVLNRTS